MYKINDNYLKLPGSYLFSTIAKKVNAYTEANPDKKVIRLGIGDGVQLRVQAIQADGRDLVECSDTVHGRMPPLGGPSGSRYLRGNVRCWHRFRRSIFYYGMGGARRQCAEPTNPGLIRTKVLERYYFSERPEKLPKTGPGGHLSRCFLLKIAKSHGFF